MRKGICWRLLSTGRRDGVRMGVRIHPTAIVDKGAVLGPEVEVGPYCVVGDGVVLEQGTRLLTHCVVLGPAVIGSRNTIYPFAVIGAAPQDRAFGGESTSVVIGDDNVIREQVTIHRGTVQGGGVTKIGHGSLLMVGTHVAHDVVVDDKVTLANGTMLGGHVHVGSWVVTGGGAAIAPFVCLGESAFIAGGAMVERNVPPFVIAAGDRARVRALNRVGLKRRRVPESSQAALKRAFRILFLAKQPLAVAIEQVDRELGADAFVARLVTFLRQPTGARDRNRSD